MTDPDIPSAYVRDKRPPRETRERCGPGSRLGGRPRPRRPPVAPPAALGAGATVTYTGVRRLVRALRP